VDALSAGYGRSQALFGLSLRIPPRGATAILGRNGAGKSTLLKTLFGELAPMAGTIRFDGAEMQNEAAERRIRRGLGYVPQEHAIFAKLTVRENLLLGGIRQPDRSGLDYVLDFFPKLAQRLGQTAGTLSGGERKMLSIARALALGPDLLLLDEPFEGLSPAIVPALAAAITAIARLGPGILLAESNIHHVPEHASRLYVIERGEIVFAGSPAEARRRPELSRIIGGTL
jgi:branched-chain amino acid transport system ATP-binding protein